MDRDKPQRFHPNSTCEGYLRDLGVYVIRRIGGRSTVENVKEKSRLLAEASEILGLSYCDYWTVAGAFSQRPIRRKALARLKWLHVNQRAIAVLKLVILAGAEAHSIQRVRDEETHQARRGSSEGCLWLEEFSRALRPYKRGRRAKASNDYPVNTKVFYYEELFRLYHIDNTLCGTKGDYYHRVKVASESYDLPTTKIREFFNYPNSIRAKARLHVCEKLQISENRLLNIL